jgi:DDE superfamily endonuclease
MTVAEPHRAPEEPTMTFSDLPPFLSRAFDAFASWLDRRTAARLPLLLTGVLFAHERRTVTSWLRAAGITDEFRPAYHAVYAVGRRSEQLAVAAWQTVRPCLTGRRLLVALDDTPTARSGPCVEGAGTHRNPTPGPAGAKLLYGHVWVSLAALAHHPTRGTIALPLHAQLYVRKKDVPTLPPHYRWPFRTKLELAADELRRLKPWVEHRFDELVAAVDGGYAKRPFLKPAKETGFQVISRLRKDAALWSVPGPKPAGRRGPAPTYGKERISLAKRAGHQRGWQQVTCVQYGAEVTKTVKTFLATWRPAGGTIRVVLVKEDDGWLPLFSTNPQATVTEILEGAADRGAHEQAFKDVKEVWGAGQQQVRNVYANVGAFNLCGWMYSTVESWAWDKPDAAVVDRSASPWDDPTRRASHADKRKALQRQVLRAEIDAALSGPPDPGRIRELAEQLLALAA